MGKTKNLKFKESLCLNDRTYINWCNRLRKVALSIFEWTNLPSSMNGDFLEKCLYYFGSATILYDEKLGFINTNCSSNGEINIYGYPTSFNCYSYGYQQSRVLYTGLKNEDNIMDTKQCILVMNTIERQPTTESLDLFAYRLYEIDRTCDINVIAQKMPILLLCDHSQRQTILNLYNEWNGNQPFIFGTKKLLETNDIKCLKTDAPFVADKLIELKKEIINEFLTFLGINNLQMIKKERMITDEANSNNEFINLNLQSFLAPRKEACRQFNELFGFTNTDKAIDVKVRSDLHNVIKDLESIVNDMSKEVDENE